MLCCTFNVQNGMQKITFFAATVEFAFEILRWEKPGNQETLQRVGTRQLVRLGVDPEDIKCRCSGLHGDSKQTFSNSGSAQKPKGSAHPTSAGSVLILSGPK